MNYTFSIKVNELEETFILTMCGESQEIAEKKVFSLWPEKTFICTSSFMPGIAGCITQF